MYTIVYVYHVCMYVVHMLLLLVSTGPQQRVGHSQPGTESCGVLTVHATFG